MYYIHYINNVRKTKNKAEKEFKIENKQNQIEKKNEK